MSLFDIAKYKNIQAKIVLLVKSRGVLFSYIEYQLYSQICRTCGCRSMRDGQKGGKFGQNKSET